MCYISANGSAVLMDVSCCISRCFNWITRTINSHPDCIKMDPNSQMAVPRAISSPIYIRVSSPLLITVASNGLITQSSCGDLGIVHSYVHPETYEKARVLNPRLGISKCMGSLCKAPNVVNHAVTD